MYLHRRSIRVDPIIFADLDGNGVISRPKGNCPKEITVNDMPSAVWLDDELGSVIPNPKRIHRIIQKCVGFRWDIRGLKHFNERFMGIFISDNPCKPSFGIDFEHLNPHTHETLPKVDCRDDHAIHLFEFSRAYDSVWRLGAVDRSWWFVIRVRIGVEKVGFGINKEIFRLGYDFVD